MKPPWSVDGPEHVVFSACTFWRFFLVAVVTVEANQLQHTIPSYVTLDAGETLLKQLSLFTVIELVIGHLCMRIFTRDSGV